MFMDDGKVYELPPPGHTRELEAAGDNDGGDVVMHDSALYNSGQEGGNGDESHSGEEEEEEVDADDDDDSNSSSQEEEEEESDEEVTVIKILIQFSYVHFVD